MQVTTYDVIPVSQSVGLMEFVPDTDQLLTVISPGAIPIEDVDAARKAYSSCAAAFTRLPTARLTPALSHVSQSDWVMVATVHRVYGHVGHVSSTPLGSQDAE